MHEAHEIHVISEVMKTTSPFGYQHNGFVKTSEL